MRLVLTCSVVLFCFASSVLGNDFASSKFGVIPQARIWTTLLHLLGGSKSRNEILTGLYPIITGLDDDGESSQELVERVAHVLSNEYNNDDIGSLLLYYYDLYPMGFPAEGQEFSNANYFVLNNKIFNSSEDIFYFKSGDLKKQSKIEDISIIQEDDIVIGKNPNSPIVVFYGCPDEQENSFAEFNRCLYSDAIDTGKLRFIWRPTCSFDYPVLEGTVDYPMDLTKRENTDEIDWIWEIPSDMPEQFLHKNYKLTKKNDEEFLDMDLAVSSLIANTYRKSKDFKSTFELIKGISNNFPLIIDDLLKLEKNEDIVQSNEDLKKKGIDYNMLGLYINGQNIRYSILDEVTLLNYITAEYKRTLQFQNTLKMFKMKNFKKATKSLLSKFSTISLSNLQEMQPIKIDLHRHPAFSNSVIYFNDVEKDAQYKGLSKKVSKFYEKSKFGEVPEYRKNWNEVIFVIDFNDLENPITQEAFSGLMRALTVIEQGYPQRVGLLPLNTGTDPNIINSIYELKQSSLKELIQFLTELHGNENGERTDEEFIYSDFEDVPGVSALLDELQIYENSIIINGEIYPFKPNTWHYLLSRVIKKDTALLKKELKRYEGKKNVDVRGLLHLKSATGRDFKYTPNYFADSTYTAMNNFELAKIKDKIITYTPSVEYALLHTITLTDNFETPTALMRLCNLLKVGFSGVRIRLINTNETLKNTNWKALQKTFGAEHSDLESKLKSMIKESSRFNKGKNASSENSRLNSAVFSKWLPDISSRVIKNVNAFLVINGRFVHFESEEIPSTANFKNMIQREAKRTIDSVMVLEDEYPDFSNGEIDPDQVEMISAHLTKLFYHSTNIYNNGIDYKTESTLPRMDLSHYLKSNGHTIFDSSRRQKIIDMTLIIDPLEERTQKILTLVDKFLDFEFINFKIVLLPTNELTVLPIERVYIENSADYISQIPSLKEHFDIDIDNPYHLPINRNDDPRRHKSVLIEVHAFDEDSPITESTVDGVSGVCLQLVDDHSGTILDTTTTMGTFGYAQFHTDAPHSRLKLQSCNTDYTITSFSPDGRPDYIPDEYIHIVNFNPKKLYVKLHKHKDLSANTKTDQTINIFTIINSESALQESNYQKMVSTILENNTQNVPLKFWLLNEPYLTNTTIEFVKKNKINLIDYQWPNWLRPQRFRTRKNKISKILFNDVLFPQNISKIIYMDHMSPETINPFIIANKLSHEKKNNYCFSMQKMAGTGYWQKGYWSKYKSENENNGLPFNFYSIDPILIINVPSIRNHLDLNSNNNHRSVGDTIRTHYQRLTNDINSLQRIDQDFINDLQNQISIRELSNHFVKPIESSSVLHDEL